jgi:calcium/calmodulin-dependent protein kinase I
MADSSASSSASFRTTQGSPTASYEIQHTLGTGSFGVVKLAVSRDDGSKWAVKCIDQSHMTREDMQALASEIAIMGALHHPHVVALREVFHDAHETYLVLEPMYGGELFDRVVTKQYYTESEACDTLLTVASAIDYCHSQGVVHRDLKPENLLYASSADDATLKVADFGLAKRVQSVEEIMSAACGTPGYVAPEVLENRGYDARADWWSVGVITYILLCGFPPFYENDNAALFRAIKHGVYDFPAPYWDDVSAQAIDVVSGLLTVNPDKRMTYQQLIQHEWVRNNASQRKNVHLGGAITQMKRFNARRKFRGGVAMAIGVSRLVKGKSSGKGRIHPKYNWRR